MISTITFESPSLCFLYFLMFLIVFALAAVLTTYALYLLAIAQRRNPLQILAGPPTRTWFKTHLPCILEYVDSQNNPHLVDFLFHSPATSSRVHEIYVQRYGRSIRIQGLGPVR